MASIKKMKSRVAKFLRKECGISWEDAFKCASLMNNGGYYGFYYYLADRGYDVKRTLVESWDGDYDDSYTEIKMKGYILGGLEYMYDTYVKASTWADNPRS